jgi:hypothetical protein
MRLMAWPTVAASVLGIVVGTVSAASQGASNSSKPLLLNLLSRATVINNFVDTGPSGFSPGDLYVFSDRLFLASAPDVQVGTVDSRCVLIDPASFRLDCSVTNHFPEGGALPVGEIMGAGTLTLVEGAASTFAIVGGTGAYLKVRGDATIKLGPFEGPHEIAANLILNP